MNLEDHAETQWQSAVCSLTVLERAVIDPYMIGIAQRDRVVQGIPRAEGPVVWRPRRVAVVDILECEVANDDVGAAARDAGSSTDIEPRTADLGVPPEADDRGIGAGPDSDPRLLRIS